jgi:hypothetical protein
MLEEGGFRGATDNLNWVDGRVDGLPDGDVRAADSGPPLSLDHMILRASR